MRYCIILVYCVYICVCGIGFGCVCFFLSKVVLKSFLRNVQSWQRPSGDHCPGIALACRAGAGGPCARGRRRDPAVNSGALVPRLAQVAQSRGRWLPQQNTHPFRRKGPVRQRQSLSVRRLNCRLYFDSWQNWQEEHTF